MSAEQTSKMSGSSSAAATVRRAPEKKPEKKGSKPKTLPPYHVLLLDDQDHTHEYVVEMMRALFGYAVERGYRIAEEVDRRKKAVVFTAHRELAELKRDQIHAYGTDMRVATCAGSMTAVVVPAD
jgi:ATP-dependent Clp protease adaptor protein ClpS